MCCVCTTLLIQWNSKRCVSFPVVQSHNFTGNQLSQLAYDCNVSKFVRARIRGIDPDINIFAVTVSQYLRCWKKEAKLEDNFSSVITLRRKNCLMAHTSELLLRYRNYTKRTQNTFRLRWEETFFYSPEHSNILTEKYFLALCIVLVIGL